MTAEPPQNALANLRYYLIWATRRRRPFLEGPLLQRAAELMVEAADSLGVRMTRVSSGGDYVIVTVEAPPDLAPATIVARLKRHSASLLRREFPELSVLPSIWTRQFLATSRDDFPPSEIQRFVETQPRNERRRYPRPGELGHIGSQAGTVTVEILKPAGNGVTSAPGDDAANGDDSDGGRHRVTDDAPVSPSPSL